MQVVLQNQNTIHPFIGESRIALGQSAAEDIAVELRQRLALQEGVRMIFAAAPSQSEMLEGLASAAGIEWSRVTAFHMDEYLDLLSDAPQRFGSWLQRHFFDLVPLAAVHRMEPGEDPSGFAKSYAAKLSEAPIDIVCCGIGANGHLAFNDPPADFEDPEDVKVVLLDAACRQQQVDDLCFARLENVPTRAVTLTIPRLLAAERIFCCVPGISKSDAVRRTLKEPISNLCPASALRIHPHWSLYLDTESASGLIE
jgi:glucosamine-6-phosphate deaminase